MAKLPVQGGHASKSAVDGMEVWGVYGKNNNQWSVTVYIPIETPMVETRSRNIDVFLEGVISLRRER